MCGQEAEERDEGMGALLDADLAHCSDGRPADIKRATDEDKTTLVLCFLKRNRLY